MSHFEFNSTSEKDYAVAEVLGSRDDGSLIFLHPEDCCSDHSSRCNERRHCCEDCYGNSEGKNLKDYTVPQGGTLEVIPNALTAKHTYIFAPTGAGKSVFCSQYANNYKMVYPSNNVFLVTYINGDDPSLSSIRDLRNIPIIDILEEKITEKTIPNSLIIFDDVDALPAPPEDGSYDPKVSFRAVEDLRDALLTRGRHYGISVIVTSHIAANYKHTKVPIDSSANVVVFPNGGNWSGVDRILKVYAGLNKEQEKRIRNLPSRWVLVHKQCPNYVIYEKGCYIL